MPVEEVAEAPRSILELPRECFKRSMLMEEATESQKSVLEA
jgi:hypothetical protein